MKETEQRFVFIMEAIKPSRIDPRYKIQDTSPKGAPAGGPLSFSPAEIDGMMTALGEVKFKALIKKLAVAE
jgi:hypothetical protein